ncbi:MAG TPA: hypothetical protein VM865_08660 [Acidobacteriaceae bacterium]|nr:hypothetical protein [Acidobacteriaceae bacterium]
MADYIYLLENRLSPAQQEALKQIREVARSRATTVFLVGGAVRDLTSGTSIRDLDVVVQGSALKLRKELEKAGGRVVGTNETFQSLYLTFPGGVRLEVGSTLAVTFPKPGKPVVKPAGILDDLRRRDFTANAMAISLNEGSYGLLMDPLNGVADIENRELRLVSNYGFIEDPARMIRATRLGGRLGWNMEERTQQRYDTGKAEGYISALSPWERSYELEEIFHEEDPLRIQRKLEAEGWSEVLFPGWNAAKANEAEVERLRDVVGQLNTMGIFPDPSAAFFPLLAAKLGAKETATLKETFARPGFVEEIESLETRTKALATQFTSKGNAAPSDAWKMLYGAEPEAVLSLAFTSKSPAVQQKFKLFFNEWPQARNKVPYALMQEMRISPDLQGHGELLEKLFFAIMDGLLETPEQTRAFLEPYSPPAPPPPPNLRRRPAKRETKAAKSKAAKPTAPVVRVDDQDGIAAGAPSAIEGAADRASVAPAAVTATAAPAKVAAAKNGAARNGGSPAAAKKGSSAGPAATVAAAVPPAAKPSAGAKDRPAAKPSPAPGKSVQATGTAKAASAGKAANTSKAAKPAPPVKAKAPAAGAKAPVGAKTGSRKPVVKAPAKGAKAAPPKRPAVVAKAAGKVPAKAPAKAAVKGPAKGAQAKAPAKRPAPAKAPAKKAVAAKKAAAPARPAKKSARR